MKLHPETLHGVHYSEEDFDAELDKRIEQRIENLGDNFDDGDYSSIRRDELKKLYSDWNQGSDSDDFIQFEMANSMKYMGFATSGFTKEDSSNPLLEPIHGISLKDYAVLVGNLANFEKPKLLKAFGIDEVVFDEINTLWPKRMQEDSSFTIVSLYGQYFSDLSSHPAIQQLKAESGAPTEDSENLKKLKTDRYFYEELNAARSAAYEYGIDGAMWIQQQYGINLMEFQGAASEWGIYQNQNFNMDESRHFGEFFETKLKEYQEKFANEQGGNVADDIEF